MITPAETPLTTVAHTIQLSVAPVFLLTALGTFLGVLSTRLGRIVDRARAVRERLRGAGADDKPPLHAELDLLRRRRQLVNMAITSGVAAALLVCAIISSLFLGSILKANVSTLAAVLFVAAMLAFTAALLLFLREILMAVANVTFDH
jgi:membrane glycosyltransferase